MSAVKLHLVLTCFFVALGSPKPVVLNESGPVFVSSYAKVSRSGPQANDSGANSTVVDRDLCCGGDFKPVYYQTPEQVTAETTSTLEPRTPGVELLDADESEESRGYPSYPSRVRLSSHRDAEDRYAARPLVKPKPPPNKPSKTTRQRLPYQPDFSDTQESYQSPQPSKPYPSSYSAGPPKTSYIPAGLPDIAYGSPSVDFPSSFSNQGPKIPYAPDYMPPQGDSNPTQDDKSPSANRPMKSEKQHDDYMPPGKIKGYSDNSNVYGPPDMPPPKQSQESHPTMDESTSGPGDSYNDYNPPGYSAHSLEVMKPPTPKPGFYGNGQDGFLPTMSSMTKPAKHKPKPMQNHPYHGDDDGDDADDDDNDDDNDNMSDQPPEKLHPKKPKIPHYPPEPGSMNPYMHSPGPEWIYHPETNEYTYPREEEEKPSKTHKDKPKKKPVLEDVEYVDDEDYPHFFHHHPHHGHHSHHKEKQTTTTTTTEKPMEDHDSEDRQKKPYSYYYLGRKLWFIPLYFSVYFIIYVTGLILKSIARHKISYPYPYEDGKKEDRSGRDLQLDDTTATVYRGIEQTENKYRNKH